MNLPIPLVFQQHLTPDNIFKSANANSAYLLGYKNLDHMIGTDIYDLPCPAAKFSDVFKKQNDRIFTEGCSLSILDIHTFSDGETHAFITKKAPALDASEHVTGIDLLAIEINHETFDSVSLALLTIDALFIKSTYASYTLSDSQRKIQLTSQEQMCLFFLLRGFSAKMIGAVLGLSKRTAEDYIQNIKIKFDCHRRDQLIQCAIHNGYLFNIPKALLQSKQFSVVLSEHV